MAGTVDGGQHVVGHANELVLDAVDSNVDHGLEHVRHGAPVAGRHIAGHDSYFNAGDGHVFAGLLAAEVEVVQVLGMEGGPGVHDGPQRDLGHGSERELCERELVSVEGARERGRHRSCGGAGDAPVMLAEAVAAEVVGDDGAAVLAEELRCDVDTGVDRQMHGVDVVRRLV